MITNQFSQHYPGRQCKGGQFSKPVILEIVKQVENGMSRGVIVSEYKISRSTIAEWMRDYGSANYHASRQGHLSQVKKTSVLRAVLDGRMTVREAMIAYRVSSSTINNWIRTYKREKGELRPVMGTKKSSEEKQTEGIVDIEKEDLKRTIQQLQLQVQALNTLIDVAEDNLKISIRKKTGAKRS